jgi:hypothetical protein
MMMQNDFERHTITSIASSGKSSKRKASSKSKRRRKTPNGSIKQRVILTSASQSSIVSLTGQKRGQPN